jgi:DNA-binding CsgD family transcriptional regulator
VRVGGDAARAAPLIAESLALYQAIGDLRCIALARAMLALVATQAGDLALAARHFGTALGEFRDVGDRMLVIFNLMGLAEVLFAQGRRGEAARLLGAAQAIGEAAGTEFARVGHVTYASFLARAQACLGEAPFSAAWAEGRALSLDRAVEAALALGGANAPARPAPPAPPAPPVLSSPAVEALTRREHEVALLVARGLTDREIADALAISPATASVHVRNILAKLDLRSRHQVGGWVTAQGPASS